MPYWVWVVLAVLDGVALAYLAVTFDWGREAPSVGSSMLGGLIQFVSTGLVIALKVLAAGFIAAVGYAIVKDVRGNWRPGRLAAALLTPVFLLVLAIIGFAAAVELRDALARPALLYADRLVVFDRLAEGHAPGESLGAYLAFLCVAAYLAEKYLLRWWNLRWPVSLAALAIVAWPIALAVGGERDQGDWVAAQQWRAVGESKTWLEALAACKALGPEWRLGRSFELSLYLATSPEAVRGRRGWVWTPTESDFGRNVVVVAFEPLRGGYWRPNLIPWRDRSLCELDATAHRSRVVNDWFSALRPWFCEAPADYEGLHVSSVQFIAQIRGSIVGGPERKWITQETTAAVICILPTQPEIPRLRHRRYPKEEEFTDPETFLARMRTLCNPRALGSDPTGCAAFGAEQQPGIAR